MDLLPDTLTRAALGARDTLVETARRTAASGARGEDPARTGAGIATAARSALFADALLGALKARLQELRSLAR